MIRFAVFPKVTSIAPTVAMIAGIAVGNQYQKSDFYKSSKEVATAEEFPNVMTRIVVFRAGPELIESSASAVVTGRAADAELQIVGRIVWAFLVQMFRHPVCLGNGQKSCRRERGSMQGQNCQV